VIAAIASAIRNLKSESPDGRAVGLATRGIGREIDPASWYAPCLRKAAAAPIARWLCRFTPGDRGCEAEVMRLLYVKAPEFDPDTRISRHLARLASDRKITTVKSAAAAINVLRKAPPDKPFQVLVTSPAVDPAVLVELVHKILEGGPLVSLVAIVADEPHALRSLRAGADAVVAFRDQSLVSPEITIRTVAARVRPTASSESAVRSDAETVARGSRVLVELSKFRQYFAKPAPPEPITVDVARRVDEDLVEAARRLVPQLAPSVRAPGVWELEQVIKDAGTTLIVAREGRTIVGMLTLHIFRAATGIHAWIQDLVVDEPVKGRGVGELLTREAVRLASTQGAPTAELVFRPSRAAAARLYERLGFERRDIHLYRYRMSS
jgi:ribosomal protein S18 acetylase RimI-like enzyme